MSDTTHANSSLPARAHKRHCARVGGGQWMGAGAPRRPYLVERIARSSAGDARPAASAASAYFHAAPPPPYSSARASISASRRPRRVPGGGDDGGHPRGPLRGRARLRLGRLGVLQGPVHPRRRRRGRRHAGLLAAACRGQPSSPSPSSSPQASRGWGVEWEGRSVGCLFGGKEEERER